MLFPNENSMKKSKDEFLRSTAVKFIDSSERFSMKERKIDYNKQFAHIYSKRLEQMRPLLMQKAIEKWGEYLENMKNCN